MASAAKSREELVLQKHYAELVSTLSRSIDEILRSLVSREVINITDKNNIKKYGDMPEDRIEYLLDRYVERSVAAGINDNFLKLLQVMKEIPECNPLAVSVEQDLAGALAGAPTVATRDDVDGEENNAIDELAREVERLKNDFVTNEEFTQLRQEIEKLHELGTKGIERLENVTSIHSQEEIHKERPTVPTAKVQEPMADSQVDIFSKKVKWKELPPLPVGRTGHTAVLLGGNVYVGGGLEGISVDDKQISYRLDVCNLTTNQWSSSPITTPHHSFAMTVLDDKLVIAGGRTKKGPFIKKVLALHAGYLKDYSEMPTARADATAVGYYSMLIVVGGAIKVGREWTRLSTTELLDTTNGCWYTCNDLPSPRQQLKTAIMNDKLYLLGGFDKDLKLSPQVFVASLDTLSTHQLNWQSAPDTPWCGSASVLYSKCLLTVGGVEQSNINIKTDSIYVFNPSTDDWSWLANIPTARSGAAVVNVNDKIMIIGGITNQNREFCNTVWFGTFE